MGDDNSYSIAIHNKYQIYDDEMDDDPSETIKRIEASLKKEKKSKADKKAAKTSKDAVKIDTSKISKRDASNNLVEKQLVHKNNKAPELYAQRKDINKENNYPIKTGQQFDKKGFTNGYDNSRSCGFKQTIGNDESRSNVRSGFGKSSVGREDDNFGSIDSNSEKVHRHNANPRFLREQDGTRGGRGRRDFVSSENGRGGFRTHRDFDRHSGSDKTGVKAVEKRDGGGSRNWGTVLDDLESALHEKVNDVENSTVLASDSEVRHQMESTSVSDKAGESASDAPDPDTSTMTLDEWRAQQQALRDQMKNKISTEASLRKANEGEPLAFKNMTLYRKQRDEDEDEEEDCYIESDSRSKKVLLVDFYFPDRHESNGRSNRGSQGRGFGRGGNHSSNSHARDDPCLNLTDDKSFPSLS